jgi:hypothetical protein
MNTNKITIATTATAVAVAIAIGMAPLLSPSAYAVKTVTVTPEECVGDPQGRERCPGQSGGGNPNREQQEEECEVTGGGDQTVRGQQKKICG